MKIGVLVAGNRPGGEATRVAARAEALGFDEVWFSEDYCERGAFAVAGAAAAATQRVAIALGVLNPWTRHPMVTAMEFGGLDEIAGGRAVLGMGASNERWMDHDLGIPFDRPLARVRESVGLLRAALAGQRLNHVGDEWRVRTGLAFAPLRPRPPIVLGVKGPRALALAGEIGDGVILSILSAPSYVRWAIEQVGRSLPASAYVAFACGTDGQKARDEVRPLVARFLGVHGDHAITRVAGLDPELAQRFRSALTEGRSATDLVTDWVLDTFAVAGDEEWCAERLRQFADAGLDTFVVRDPGDSDPDELLQATLACADHAGLR